MNARVISITTYISIAIAVIDQLVKRWAEGALFVRSIYPFGISFTLGLSEDHGMGFILQKYDFSWLASVFFIVLWLMVFFMLSRWRLHTASKLVALAAGLMMGGIIGNLADRLRFGATLDMFNFSTDRWHFGFNFADIAIICGICLLVIDALIGESRRERLHRPRVMDMM